MMRKYLFHLFISNWNSLFRNSLSILKIKLRNYILKLFDLQINFYLIHYLISEFNKFN